MNSRKQALDSSTGHESTYLLVLIIKGTVTGKTRTRGMWWPCSAHL